MAETSYNHHINLDDFRRSAVTDGFLIATETLEEGQVMVKIHKLALTSNSVSYVTAGKTGVMPFLDLYPAPDGLAHILCWGYGDVVYSKHRDVKQGERLYGFFPTASHAILTVGKTKPTGFTDIRPGREVVAPFYSEFAFARKLPGYAPEFEETVMLFQPLFGTSFLLQSYCEDHEFFNADRIVISSASAKTSMGFGHLLKKNHGDHIRTIGLTSSRNKDFVDNLGCFDHILTYDELDKLESGGRALFFDVAGNRDIMMQVHRHLGEAIVYSGKVGQTHWDTGDESTPDVPGAKQVFWSGPDQVMKLRERHGIAAMGKMIQGSMVEFLMTAHRWIEMVRAQGPDAIDARVKSMLDGKIEANEGIILMP